jgi:asparagine synthase (glutamine-hydrolysing)
MSKLAGILCFGDQSPSPADEDRIRLSLESLNGFPPSIYPGDRMVMGHAAPPWDTVWDSRCSTSPEGVICAWDGRLDNSASLPAPERAGDSVHPPQSAYALDAYLRRGVAGFRDLVGDWSLVIWDPRSRSIVLASDYAGIRPLYYHLGGGSLRWSTSLADLVGWTGTHDIDEEYVVSFLTHGSAAHHTPYRGVFPVSPGNAVTIRSNRAVKEAFWELPFDRETRLKDECAYEEELRRLFEEAVSVRLKGHRTACSELSGGLDSSSIVCMAKQLATKSPGLHAELVTFSYTHPAQSEERYFHAVERACRYPSSYLQLEEFPFVAPNRVGNAAPSWWEPRFEELSRRMAALDSSVLLTGQLGDFIMGNTHDDSDQVADYIHNHQYVEAAREAFSWSQTLRVPIYSVLWRALRTNYSSWVAPDVANDVCDRYASVDSLAPGFRKRVALSKYDSHHEFSWNQAGPGRRRRFRGVSEVLSGRVLQAPEALQHISYAHPFAHRPLLEFMLTIPQNVVCKPGEPRRLMRRAFSTFLPPMVLKRKSKALYHIAYREALMPLAADLLRRRGDMRLVEFGYVDRGSFVERLTRFTGGIECNESQLRQLILLEYWLSRGGASAVPLEEAALSWVN